MRRFITLGLIISSFTVYSQKYTISSFGTQLNKSKVPSVDVRGKLNVKDTMDVTGATLLGFPTGGSNITLGSSGYLQKVSGTSALSNSPLFDDGTHIGINTPFPHPAFSVDIQSNAGSAGMILRSAAKDMGFHIFPETGLDGMGLQSVNYGSSVVKPLYINYGGGNVRIGSQTPATAMLSVTGNVTANDATANDHLTTLGQINANYVKKTDSTTIYTGTYIKGTGKSDNPLDVDISKFMRSGNAGFTADGTTKAFTFTTSNITGYNSDSKVFITITSSTGTSVEYVDMSDESYTVYFVNPPTAGEKTFKYFIIP